MPAKRVKTSSAGAKANKAPKKKTTSVKKAPAKKKPVAKKVAAKKVTKEVKKVAKTPSKKTTTVEVTKTPKKAVPAKPVAKPAAIKKKMISSTPKPTNIKKPSQTINKVKTKGSNVTVKALVDSPEFNETEDNVAQMNKEAGMGPVAFTAYQPKRGEEYMNFEQRQHFVNILRCWKQELMEEVDRTVLHMKDEAANFPDPNDRATQEEEFSLELRTRDRERKLIKKIDEALKRIENDEYGYCEACGVEIGVRRLEARPTATLCIDCKTLEEIRERQMAS